jgi:hypothetical protein
MFSGLIIDFLLWLWLWLGVGWSSSVGWRSSVVTGGPPDGSVKMPEEQSFREGLIGVATDGVEGAPLIDFVTPDRRVLALHGGALVTVGIEVGEHLDMLGLLCGIEQTPCPMPMQLC